MKKRLSIIKILWQCTIYLVVGSFMLTGLLRVGMLLFARQKTYPPNTVPEKPVALVLGAGLNRDGTPGIVLRDRVDTAVDLYFAGKVTKILMSGDNSTIHYNEPGAMREYALSLGVPDEDIVLDYAGRRTYDSCYRAGAIFGVDEVIVITQRFHLSRAIFLCSGLKINTVGVSADDSHYPQRRYLYWRLREVIASVVAYGDILLKNPPPILGEVEPIFQN
jgi:SanA protein